MNNDGFEVFGMLVAALLCLALLISLIVFGAWASSRADYRKVCIPAGYADAKRLNGGVWVCVGKGSDGWIAVDVVSLLEGER